MTGQEWVIEAHGCAPGLLRSLPTIEALFARAIAELSLHPVAPAVWHVFPPPGGVSGLVLLSESHLTCHTFPESGTAAFNLYCCRPRAPWDFEARLREALGAQAVEVRTLARCGLVR